MNSSKHGQVREKSLIQMLKANIDRLLKYFAIYFISLFYWELLLKLRTGLGSGNIYFIVFIPAQAMFFTLLSGWFKCKINKIVTPVILLLVCIYYIVQLVYYSIFQGVFTLSMIGMATDATNDFGGGVAEEILPQLGWIFLFLLPVIIVAALAYFAPKKFFKRYTPFMHIFSLLKTVLLWFLAIIILLVFGTGRTSPYIAFTSASIDTDTSAARLGFLTSTVVELKNMIFDVKRPQPTIVIPETEDLPQPDPTDKPNIINGIDFEALERSTDDEGKKELSQYFSRIRGTNKNDYTGILKNYNLIYICAESFCSYAVDPVVTPTLYKMSQGGIVLNNYYNSFKNTTTNGEFAFNTGIWPDVSRDADTNSKSGSFVQSKDKYLPFALGNMFENSGVKTYAYHNYKGYYYSREETHPNLGYTSLRFMDGENRMTFTNSWPSSDLEMMEQSIGDYINNDRFHAYYMTFSGHGPYSSSNRIAVNNYKTVKELTKDRDLPDEAIYYLAANYELELAMDYLLDSLEAAGKLNNTLIVLTGDHYPYYLGSYSLNALAGRALEKNFEMYKSSCIMYTGGISPVQVYTPCCNVDILPTVLNLFGMEFDSRLLPGTDIFSDSEHYALLYNMSFVTDKVKYNASSGDAEWFGDGYNMSEQEKEEYLQKMFNITDNSYAVSLTMMEEDYYRFVFNKY